MATLYKRKKFSYELTKIICAFIIAVIPFLSFNYILYKNEVSVFYHAIFKPFILAASQQSNPHYFISGFFNNIIFYPLNLIKENIFLLFSIIGLIYLLKKDIKFKSKDKIIIVTTILILGYFMYIPSKQIRFSLIFLPYLCLLAAYGFYFLIKSIECIKILKITALFTALILFILTISPLVEQSVIQKEFSKEIPIIVKEYYSFRFNSDTILTTDPVFTVYSDKRFIPIYFSIENANYILNSFKEQSYTVVYREDAFFCPNNECLIQRENLFKTISQNKLVFNKTYYGQEYYLFFKE